MRALTARTWPLLAVVLCSARPSWARKIPITLLSTERPDIVCVLGRTTSRNAIQYKGIRQQVFELQKGEGWVFGHGDFGKLKPDRPPELQAQRWDFIIDGQRRLLQNAHDALYQAQELRVPASDAACSEPRELCRPQVHKDIGGVKAPTSWLSLLCAASPRARSPVQSVALVGFDFLGRTQDEPLLTNAYFDGRVLSADFSTQSNSDSSFSLSSLGGTYQISLPQLGIQSGTALELFPLCSQRVVHLPALARDATIKSGKRSVRADIDGHQCSAEVDGAGRFTANFVAGANDAAVGSLRATLQPLSKRQGSSEFSESWAGRLPPEPLKVKVTQLSFSWQPHCMYDLMREDCPTVELPVQGVTCAGKKIPALTLLDGQRVQPPVSTTSESALCVYRECLVAPSAKDGAGAPVTDSLSLPVAVTFRNPDRSLSWTDNIVAVDQRLQSYVSPDAFVVTLDGTHWADMPNGDKVSGWFVTTADGTSRWVPQTKAAKDRKSPYIVAVPRARCTDNLILRAVGQRRYEDLPRRISQGRVSLGKPEDTAHRMAFGVDAAYAWFVPISERGLAGEQREQPDAYPSGLIGVWGAFKPAKSGWWFELNADFVFSNHLVYTPRLENAAASRFRLFYRIPFLLSVGFPVVDRVSLGGGVGYVYGDTLYSADKSLFDTPDHAGAAQVFARFRATRDLALEGRVIWIFEQEIQAYDTDFRGDVVRQTAKMHSLAFALGLRWDIASGSLVSIPPEDPETAEKQSGK